MDLLTNLPESDWTPPNLNDLPRFKDMEEIGIDCETRDPNLLTLGPGAIRGDGEVVGVSIAGAGHKYYLPFGHEGGGNLEEDNVRRWLRDNLSGSQPKVGANILYDLEWLRSFGVDGVGGPYVDVQHVEALLDENRGRYNLGSLAWKYFKVWKSEELLRDVCAALDYDPKGDMWRLHSKYVGVYAEDDAELPLLIWKKQRPKLRAENLEAVYEIEQKLVPILLEMRWRGVPIDLDKVEQLRERLIEDERRHRRELASLAGTEVDIWSSQSIARAADALGLSYEVTAKGNPSFRAEWLNRASHPFFGKVLAARRANKLIGTFIDGMVYKHQVGGRLHPQANQLRTDEYGTVTGRFSYSSPNLQQVPARDAELAPLVRGFFTPEDGELWLKADYSQQEPRIQMHYAALLKIPGVESLVQQYRSNPRTDYHTFVSELTGLPRAEAKAVNLGLAYGMGKTKLFEQSLGVDEERGEQIWSAYFERMSFLRELQNRCMDKAQSTGFVRTILGRRRRFNQWEPKGNYSREPALGYKAALDKWGRENVQRAYTYKALNAIVQGSGADMVKCSLINLWDAGYRPYLTVHDEIDMSISDPKQAKEVAEIMQHPDPISLEVPLVVDPETGPSWGEVSG